MKRIGGFDQNPHFMFGIRKEEPCLLHDICPTIYARVKLSGENENFVLCISEHGLRQNSGMLK